MNGDGVISPNEDAIGYLFRRACQIHSALTVECLQPTDLRPVHFLVLEVTMLAPGRDAAQISAWTMLDPAMLSASVRRLVDDGLLERRADPTDRRAKMLFPTAIGNERAKRGQALMRAARRQLEQRLRAAEWSALIPLLQRVSRLRVEGPCAGAPAFPHFSDIRFLLRCAHNLHTAMMSERLAPFDLTMAQFLALDAMDRAPGVVAAQVAEIAALDAATLSVLLHRLVADELLRRAANPADRRAKLLYLTRKGAALLRRVEPAVRDARHAMKARMSARDWHIVIAALTHYCDVIEPPSARRAVARENI